MTDITTIVEIARSIIAGGELSYEKFDLIDWNSESIFDKDLNCLWWSIRRFVDDEDIRKKDKQYDSDLRSAISEDLMYLMARIENHK